MSQGRFPRGVDIKADIKAPFVVKDVSAVKNGCGFNHGIVYFAVIKITGIYPKLVNGDFVFMVFFCQVWY
jgi:hypothetical protein